MTGKLISCNSCGKEISMLAASCPSCGAPNQWIHPSISNFINNQEQFKYEKTPPFNYTWDKLSVNGICQRKSLIELILEIFGYGLIGLTATSWFFMDQVGIHSWLLYIPVSFAVLLLILKGVISGNANRTFRADFSNGDMNWVSNDDEFWIEVKNIFEGKFSKKIKIENISKEDLYKQIEEISYSKLNQSELFLSLSKMDQIKYIFTYRLASTASMIVFIIIILVSVEYLKKAVLQFIH